MHVCLCGRPMRWRRGNTVLECPEGCSISLAWQIHGPGRMAELDEYQLLTYCRAGLYIWRVYRREAALSGPPVDSGASHDWDTAMAMAAESVLKLLRQDHR